MRKFGLIGYPLGHSFSRQYFSDKFLAEKIIDCVYENFPLKHLRQVCELVKNEPDLAGLNITIPYKTEVIPLLDSISQEAEEIWAVNVVKISRRDGKIHLAGFNSDTYGFRESLVPFIRGELRKAIVLGSGGSSKAVVHTLRKMGIDVMIVSRNPGAGEISYSSLTGDMIRNAGLIVNTTPLGMYPDVDSMPGIDYSQLDGSQVLYDLVYNPEVTAFLKMGKERGCVAVNGLEMLHLQAERSWQIWNDPSL